MKYIIEAAAFFKLSTLSCMVGLILT